MSLTQTPSSTLKQLKKTKTDDKSHDISISHYSLPIYWFHYSKNDFGYYERYFCPIRMHPSSSRSFSFSHIRSELKGTTKKCGTRRHNVNCINNIFILILRRCCYYNRSILFERWQHSKYIFVWLHINFSFIGCQMKISVPKRRGTLIHIFDKRLQDLYVLWSFLSFTFPSNINALELCRKMTMIRQRELILITFWNWFFSSF